MFTREQIKGELKKKGWSYRTAARKLNRSYQHVSYVLNGHRESVLLLRELNRLPAKKERAA
jgi:lambda repressor-like predicted transcriptional regulator